MDNVKELEILSDKGSVNIPITRYENLVKRETALKIIENMYRSKNFATYEYNNILELILGKKGEEKDAE